MTTLPENIGPYHVVGQAGRGRVGTRCRGDGPCGARDVAIEICSAPDQEDETTHGSAR